MLPKKLKILFLQPYPYGVAAGQRFKIEQAYNFLKNEGHEVVINSFFAMSTWEILYKDGHTFKKIMGTLLSWVKRGLFIFTIHRYDVVYNFMWVTPRGAPVAEWIVRKLAKRLIVDVDDRVYDTDNKSFLENLTSCHYKSNFLVKNGDTVIHNSPYSVEECSRINIFNNAIHIPCSFDLERYRRKAHKQNELITIGWTGTISSIPYLKKIEPMLIELYAIQKFKLILITNFDYSIDGLDLEVIQWSAKNEIEDLLKFDIGIYPVFIDNWSKSKGGLKVQQYMAMGLPSVSTNHGAASHYINHENTGYLVDTDKEWIHYLHLLLGDANLREAIGRSAREQAEKSFSINASIKAYRKVICEQ
jgi:L-malate glycosyltransferase